MKFDFEPIRTNIHRYVQDQNIRVYRDTDLKLCSSILVIHASLVSKHLLHIYTLHTQRQTVVDEFRRYAKAWNS